MTAAGFHADPNELPVDKQKPYEKPRVLASYDKEELEAAMQPQGLPDGGGCGCSCGSAPRRK